MYQFDTSFANYTLKQTEAVLNQSNAMFAKMIDDSIEFNRAMMNFEFVDMISIDTLAILFPSTTASGTKKKSVKPQRSPQTKAIAQAPVRQDDLKMILGVGPGLEKKLQDAGIVSYAQIAMLTDAKITELETNVIKFTGRIKRDDWVGQATQLMAQ
jgi:predicted flap endonuclease-1-like 5' DNA nuclease